MEPRERRIRTMRIRAILLLTPSSLRPLASLGVKSESPLAAWRHDEADDLDRGPEDRRSLGSTERHLDARCSGRSRSGYRRRSIDQVARALLLDFRQERQRDHFPAAAVLASARRGMPARGSGGESNGWGQRYAGRGGTRLILESSAADRRPVRAIPVRGRK